MVWQRELIRLRRTPTRIITGLAQPIIFLFIVGSGLGHLIQQGVPGGLDYEQFLFPGILSMSIITSALFSVVSIVWDREFGFMHEMLVAPVSLTINGITKAVSFPVEFSAVEVHPADGKHHAGFSATTVINRNDFGVDFNMPLGMDKLALGQKVNVELELQFVPA